MNRQCYEDILGPELVSGTSFCTFSGQPLWATSRCGDLLRKLSLQESEQLPVDRAVGCISNSNKGEASALGVGGQAAHQTARTEGHPAAHISAAVLSISKKFHTHLIISAQTFHSWCNGVDQ